MTTAAATRVVDAATAVVRHYRNLCMGNIGNPGARLWRGGCVLVASVVTMQVLHGCGTGGGGGLDFSNTNGNGRGNSNGAPANENSAGGQDGTNQNANAAANGNGAAGDALPASLQGEWTFSGDCAAFTMTVAADGDVSLVSSGDCISADGAVGPDGSFVVTVTCEFNIFGDPTEPVECTPTLSGVLDPDGLSMGSSVRNCVGDLVDSPCSFVVSR